MRNSVGISGLQAGEDVNSLLRFLAFSLVFTGGLPGQSIRVPPSTTNRDRPGTFSLILDLSTGKSPVALQWEISAPSAVAIEKEDIFIHETAAKTGKALTCAPRVAPPNKQPEQRYACILAGGQASIPAGPIASVRYRAQTDVHGAPIRVVIDRILGVSGDLKPNAFPDATAIISIR